MKNILIIYPHWPPSNLAGVHRPRLIANYLHDVGWKPIILTVAARYYEETPDPEICRTVAANVEVIHTKAYKVIKPRLIGDIGLRAFPYLYNKALNLIKTRNINFIWIPIPSFYTALLGRALYRKTAVPYGIDYIDPWVRDIHNRKDLRSQLSLQTAKWLEPIAVKKASLLSGVSQAYYQPVIDRNFTKKQIAHVSMPYGFDLNDHRIKLDNLELPWNSLKDCQPLVYAGAFLPNSHLFIRILFNIIAKKVKQGHWNERKHLYFIGTGNYTGVSITDYAEEFGIADIVHENRGRFPYLHVLNYLSAAYAVMAIGSTEQHYTASKIFQALLSERPVLAIFHKESSAVSILETSSAANYLIKYDPEDKLEDFEKAIDKTLNLLLEEYISWQPDLTALEQYSAQASAKALADKLNEIIDKN
jgi:hypothetical protein